MIFGRLDERADLAPATSRQAAAGRGENGG